MIKKFSFPQNMFEPMFLTGSLAVLSGAAPPPFRIFAGLRLVEVASATQAGASPHRHRRRERPTLQNLSDFATIFDNLQ